MKKDLLKKIDDLRVLIERYEGSPMDINWEKGHLAALGSVVDWWDKKLSFHNDEAHDKQ